MMMLKQKLKNLSHLLPMSVTFKHLLKPPITIQYPEQREVMKPRYRGRQRLDVKKCISCGSCARACPNATIQMKVVGIEEKKVKDRIIKKEKKHPEIYLGRCMFCGLCIEACPTGALTWDSEAIELAEYSREELFYPWWKLAGYEREPEQGGETQ